MEAQRRRAKKNTRGKCAAAKAKNYTPTGPTFIGRNGNVHRP